MFQLMHLVLNLLQVSKGGERRFMHRGTGFKIHVLGQKTKAHIACAHDVAAIRRLLVID
jgi:hypothetical protein